MPLLTQLCFCLRIKVMMWRYLFIVLCALVALLQAEQRCQLDGGIRKLNGRPCASTTRYNDGHRGACGCGPPGGDQPFDWNMADYTTAPSQKYFDNGGDSQWCGRNCGKCVELCPTGGYVPNEGGSGATGCHTFLVTNDCPYAGNEKWCEIHAAPGQGQHNQFGYEVHFDLQNARGQIDRLGWNNPEVTWREVGCPGNLANFWNQCECHNHGK